ncbi:hypothetical protein AUK40_04195 [Candidatus Wirthbacteria bacterium CG2_30_54_11]|uniref:Uncharacterized protein n=1 Tax=Candidatus Wirthbacteria bacterium CG2_30_54_11 TaxID=1817892 RepID=A0A1J5IIV3_9BACT|nr:MAG: hypothetical protein AUK40_04195 [Candidatus Wirthbacteria bacterium CG2_30_54_11]
MKKIRRLLDEYRYPGFEPQATLNGVFGDPQARVITLVRRQKKQDAALAAGCAGAIMTKRCD